MNTRNYQPALIWALAADYAAENLPAPAGLEIGHTDLALYIFRTDKPGAYYMHGPKLYWQDEPNGSSFTNCDQDELSENADSLGEVTLTNRRTRKTVLLGKDFSTAFMRLRGSTPGPVPMGHDRTLPAIGVPSALGSALGERAEELGVSVPDVRRRAYEEFVKK